MNAMRQLIFFSCLFLMSLQPVAAQTYEELCERAATAIERDSLAQAEQYIRQALRLDPANGRSLPIWVRYSVVGINMRRLWILIRMP